MTTTAAAGAAAQGWSVTGGRTGVNGLSTRTLAVRLFITCWLIYALHFATNTVREIYPALSLGDRLSFDVSEYLGLHPDIFAIAGRGAYINNNPGASIMGAVPYALARPVIDRAVAAVQQARRVANQPPPEYNSIYPMAREFFAESYRRGFDVKFGLGAGVMQALLMAPLSALSVVVMFWLLLKLVARRTALLLALLYGLATPVFYRTAQLNHNLLIGHCALFAFALLWQPWQEKGPAGRLRFVLAGLLTGWTLVLDYSGLVAIAALGFYTLLRYREEPTGAPRRQALAHVALGAVAAAAVLPAYQWLAFGNPLYPAQHYMPATQYSGYGMSGMGLPQLDLLLETAFSIRFGLFTSAPLLLLALWPPAWLSGRYRLLGQSEMRFIALFTLAFFLFASANQYGRLQFNSGIRYVVPLTPFLFLAAAGVLIKLPRPAALAFAGLAAYWSWCLAMWRDVEQGWGILEAIKHITLAGPRLPWLATLQGMGYLPPVNLTLPILLLAGVALWLLWQVRLPQRQSEPRAPASSVERS